ncbi:RnfABCDGE type electron transport complex subunit B, partial [Bordetella pertussis]|uniref:RnfABCDGE type electron transport complex subunit B n=1 Tax=Bordetella pertussis TaxID=520 RepID=UPI000B077243
MSSCSSLVDRIDALLPQTQCTKCGYDGCRPYAQAIADGAAAINRCPPGDESGVAALAALLDTPPLPLDRARGEPGPLLVAVIDEAHCIGCTLCMKACHQQRQARVRRETAANERLMAATAEPAPQ